MIRTKRPFSCSAGMRLRADVEHRLVEPADQLVGDGGERTAVGDLALDALGDDLVVAGDLGLEVAVLRVRLLAAARHGAERAHAAVGLELLAVDEDRLAGRLLAAREQRADHHRVGARDDRLGDVTRLLQAAVGDHRHPGRPAREGRLVDRCDLGDAAAGDHARRTDGSRTEADLHRVGARVDERLGALAGGDVAADDLHVLGRGVALEPAHHVEQQRDVAVGGVGDQDVDAGLDQGGGPLPGVAEVADGGAHHQAAVVVVGASAGTARTSRSP